MAFDLEQRAFIINTSAEMILNVKAANYIGCDVEKIPMPTELKSIITSELEYFNEVIHKHNIQIVVTKVFNFVKGVKIGCVITFQKIKSIQSMEENIRKRLIGKGHEAKKTFDDIVAISDITKNIVKVAKQFSKTNSNILLTGRSGTGKEIFAQSIHNFSNRKNGSFVAVNCASLPKDLLESELFGYVAGAFTGALKTGKMGFFELAHNGTIFLDEIGEIPMELQAKLLRVLQEREFTRLGDDHVVTVNVRVIAASNQNLAAMVKKGLFREDLFYRLDVLRINLPDISSRREDIPVLAENFIRQNNPQRSISDGAKNLLKSFQWEGNVRQINNFCERLEVLSKRQEITEDDVVYVMNLEENNLDLDTNYMLKIDKIDEEFQNNEEAQAIYRALLQAKYNKQEAARLLGMNRSTLWRKMKEYRMN